MLRFSSLLSKHAKLHTVLSETNRRIFIQLFRLNSTFKKPQTTDNEGGLRELPQLNRRYIFVRTCVDFWEDLPAGVLFDTAYLDTHSEIPFGPDTPTIVALHDTPGSSDDLIPILQPFCNIGYRVIAPTFPGFGKTKGTSKYDDITFTGKTDERITFLHNFLQTIGVERVDLLIGHGTGCNTAVSYTANVLKQHEVKSLALISPIGHRPSRNLKEYPAIIEFEHLWNQYTLCRLPLKIILHLSTAKKLKFLLEYQRKDRLKVMLHFAGFQFNLLSSDSCSVGLSSLPRLVTHNMNNPLVDTELMEEYSDLIGIPEENVCTCSENSAVTVPENDNTALKFVKFEDKDYSLQKYSAQLTLLLQDLLKHLNKKR